MFELAKSIPGVIRLEFGEPDFDTPEAIKQAAFKALERGATKYTSSYGVTELRSAIAKKMGSENHVRCREDNVVVTTGATSALMLSMLSALNPGDEILIPDPGWSNYASIARISGAVPVGYPLHEKDCFVVDSTQLGKLITPKTRMILINSPSNPTGAVIGRDALRALGVLALKHDLMILADEVYEKFVYDSSEHTSIASFPDFRDIVITTNSFSKTYAMTGWRLGYAVASESLVEAMGRLNGSTNSCTATMTQYAGIAALSGSQRFVLEMVESFNKRRKLVFDEIASMKNISCSPPQGAFYLFPNVSKVSHNSSELAIKILTQARVATVPGSAFGSCGEGHLRLAYANSEENLKEALRRIKSLLN